MPDSPASYRDLPSIYHDRMKTRAPAITAMREIDDAIHGRFPERFDALLPEQLRIELRLIGMADRDLYGIAKKVFPVKVDPYADNDKRREEAEKVERVAYGWNNGLAMRGGVEMDGIMGGLVRHQIRYADGTMVVWPDKKRKLLYFTVHNPQQHFPPVGWTPLSPHGLNGTMFVYEETLGELKRRFPDASFDLDKRYTRRSGFRKTPAPDSFLCTVAEYFSDEAWIIATVDDDGVRLFETSDGDRDFPGVCNVVSFMQNDIDPIFSGQVGLEVAAQKFLAQEIEAGDQMLHAPIFHSPLQGGDMKWRQPNIFDNTMGEKPFAMRLSPTSPVNTANVLGQIIQLARLGNINPESFQGGGAAVSGKAIDKLQGGPRSVVQNIIWEPFLNGFPRAYDICIDIETKLWPNEQKKAKGTKGKESFEITYRPGNLLPDYKHRIKIEEGFGLGGYQQVLEGLQLMGAGAMSQETFVENHPGIRDTRRELRRIAAEKTASLIPQLATAQPENVSLRGLFEVMKQINNGKSEAEAWIAAHEAGLLQPPTPEPEVGPPGLPEGGIPPELMAMMGGGLPSGEQAALPPPGMI